MMEFGDDLMDDDPETGEGTDREDGGLASIASTR